VPSLPHCSAKLLRSNGSAFSVVYTRSKRPLRKKEATHA
jgi:hypothetical protein